jgi:asparagine synthase (glutamine-hydrolysing)
MDSSSIVCVADRLIARNPTAAQRVDTVSYFDDSETTWNERPYFTEVEKLRGQNGIHIDTGKNSSFPQLTAEETFAATPGAAARRNATARRLDECLLSSGSRVILSGIGGDEVLGGIMTSIPELADLLARCRLIQLTRQSLKWAISRRQPLYKTLANTVRAFLPVDPGEAANRSDLLPWLERSFVQRYARALHGYPKRLRLFGARPSLQSSLHALGALRRHISCYNLPHPLYEKRFPFLDRDLWEFVCAIPREQVVRPNQRRSLMRRALTGTVPPAILNRQQKAFVSRAPLASMVANWNTLINFTEHMVSGALAIVNPRAFVQSLVRARDGKETSALPLLRTLLIELWLKNVTEHCDLGIPALPQKDCSHTKMELLTARES